MVVMEKEDYIQKTDSLLAQLAYRTIDRDPTSQIKAKLVTTLRKIKKDTNIDEGTYKTMYPTSCMPPSFNYEMQTTITLLGVCISLYDIFMGNHITL